MWSLLKGKKYPSRCEKLYVWYINYVLKNFVINGNSRIHMWQFCNRDYFRVNVYFFKWMDFNFKNSFRFTQNGSWNSLKHPFPLLTDYPIINILHYCGTFVTTDEQISISLCSTVLWILTNGIHHYSIIQFHCSKNPLSSPVHSYPALPPSTLLSPCNYWSFYCVYHFAFSECHGWKHTVGSFSEWLLSLGNKYLWLHHAFMAW